MTDWLETRKEQINRTLRVIMDREDAGWDGGARYALDKVLDVLLAYRNRATHPSEQELQEAVSALEMIAGRKYVEKLDPADEIVVAQADLDDGLFKQVRPEDCNPELRKATIELWIETHTKAATKAVGAPESDDVMAAMMVDQMIITGAFLVPYGEMRAGQQLFWRQRAAGYNHSEQTLKIN